NESGMREKVEKKTATFQFKSNLKLGSQGTEVKELQKCLARFPEIYPEGEITGIFGDKTKAAVILFQEKYREEILVPNDLDQGNGEIMGSTRKKLNEVCFDQGDKTIPLKIVLSTVDQPQLVEVANILKEQWKSLGVDLEVKTFDIASLERDVIRYRDYEAILFGEILGIIPDPFPFWHSSQKKDPGLNLSEYENKDCDKLLETARQSLDEIERETSLEKFQNLLLKDAPAVFLYTPDYLYFVAKEIKGVDQKTLADPSKRFSNVENWYIETKRAWK
ncbi:MAG: peptidoglycan-binding protein, partial [Candidatus Paceibacterota bacterium]